MKGLKLAAKFSHIENIRENFYKFFEKSNILEEKPKIAVAVSGGADSMIMTILLNEWLIKRGGLLYAITIDHQLRQASADEAMIVKEWMNYYKIDHYIIKLDLDLGNNILKEARDKRYKILIEWCQKNEIYDLCVGHNLDDQAENFIIRSFRGSGIKGLASIRPILYNSAVRLIRPLLNFSKDEIKAGLKEYKQNWIEDPTNKNEKFLRVKIRNFIESQNFLEAKLLKERLVNNAEKMSMAQEVIDNKIYDFVAANVKIFGEKNVINLTIPLKEFLFLEKYVALKFLQKFLTILGKGEYSPRFRGINKLYDFLSNKFSQGIIMLNKCKITILQKDKSFLIENLLIE